MNPIQLAHSPDADDIFMYFAIKFGWVDTKGYTFENIALDIETLNLEALKGTYDVTAISFGMYPLIKDDYALLRTAVSFGEGYGPKLIRRKDKKPNVILKSPFLENIRPMPCFSGSITLKQDLSIWIFLRSKRLSSLAR